MHWCSIRRRSLLSTPSSQLAQESGQSAFILQAGKWRLRRCDFRKDVTSQL